MRSVVRARGMLLRGLGVGALLVLGLAAAPLGVMASGVAADPTCAPVPAPGQFSLRIDNPFMPLQPGTTYVFHGVSEGHQQVDTVSVTSDTKLIAGVTTRAVRDVVTQGGHVVEQTNDFYAQDTTGNVWYFGEASKEFGPGGQVSTEGSWLAGHDGATPGIIMEARPQVGDTYRQECAGTVAQDTARVLSLSESVSVPFGSFDHLLQTREFSPLEPGVAEEKYYARGIGEVKEVTVQGGSEQFVLVSVQRP